MRLKMDSVSGILCIVAYLMHHLFVYAADQPNIIFIISDDLGWNDVSFHGSNQIPTPNIDALAYNGIILNSHYVQSKCTPSRTALLTAKYPMRLGMQGDSILPAEPRDLPEGKLMPEYFKELGYATYLAGKWHLGYSRWNSTPTSRGFDHHFGFYNEFTSYYDYLTTWNFNGKDYTGFDLRRDTEPAWDISGKYATDVFTDYTVNTIQNHDNTKPLFMMVSYSAPHAANLGKYLEAPQETIDKFNYIVDANRRTYAAMVSKIDDSVGIIMEALEAKNMLENTIVVFISDNGAPTTGTLPNWGSNYPLRGLKDTLFEGGIRSVACVWSPLIVQSGRVSYDLFHITDWFPTLYSAAGGDIGLFETEFDGIDQWSSLVYNLPSPRSDILINIDEKTRNAAFRYNYWKMIVGTTYNGTYNTYFGESGLENIRQVPYNTSEVFNSPTGRLAQKYGSFNPIPEVQYENLRSEANLHCLSEKAKKNPCDPASGAVCLYNIPNDPCEENNLAMYFPSVVRKMKRALVDYRSGLAQQLNQEPDIEKDDPKLFQYTWNPWIDCADLTCTS